MAKKSLRRLSPPYSIRKSKSAVCNYITSWKSISSSSIASEGRRRRRRSNSNLFVDANSDSDSVTIDSSGSNITSDEEGIHQQKMRQIAVIKETQQRIRILVARDREQFRMPTLYQSLLEMHQ